MHSGLLELVQVHLSDKLCLNRHDAGSQADMKPLKQQSMLLFLDHKSQEVSGQNVAALTVCVPRKKSML